MILPTPVSYARYVVRKHLCPAYFVFQPVCVCVRALPDTLDSCAQFKHTIAASCIPFFTTY